MKLKKFNASKKGGRKSVKIEANKKKLEAVESVIAKLENENGSKMDNPKSVENNNIKKIEKRKLKKILNHDGILVKHQEGEKWYSYQINHVLGDVDEKMSSIEVDSLLKEGKEVLAQDSALLQTMEMQNNGSEGSWLYSVLAKGTSADKRTAMQLQMHKSPVHSLEYIEKLIGACKKQGTRDVIDIIPIMEDVFVNHCLPENRKLISFSKRPLKQLNELSSGNERSRRKIIMMWAFENELKVLYQQFIQAMVELVKRPLEDVNKRALKTLASCLSARPEAEGMILSSLVNSFGHPNYKIGSYVVYILEDISRKHPAMRMVMVNEIEQLVFRKNVNERAHLYSITFLSQMRFSAKDSELTCRLMKIYLSLFKTIVGKKITDNRLLPIVLAGANRAFPFANETDKLLEDVKDIYYLAHNSNYRTALPALKLLFQFHKMNKHVSDRFYNALYRKLLDNCPPGAYAQLLKLLFDTMKEDPSLQRVRAFVKRLLQVAVNMSSEFAASILLLISRLKTLRPNDNLLVLMKSADKSARVVSQLEDDDDEERYVDLDVDGNEIEPEHLVKTEVKSEDKHIIAEEDESDEKKKVGKGKLGASSNGGWVHRKTLGVKSAKSPYDPVARNPLYVDASQVSDNELILLSSHFHPSVAVFAKQLKEGGEINYGGDSLNDFNLMSFLDRFAFRNPKEVASSQNRVVRKKAHDPWGVRKLAVESKEYTQKKREEIPVDERFLHRYTSSLVKEKKVKKDEKEDEWEYAESVNSMEFDQIMERFEPGELNEEFDIDYSKEFSAEKNKKNKKAAVEEEVDIDEDDELYGDEDGEDDDDDDDAEDDDNEKDDDDDDSDEDDDDEEENFGNSKGGNSNIFGEDDISSDEEIGENDYELAGDRFAEMLEELSDDDGGSKKKSKGKKQGKRPAKGSFGKGNAAKKPKRR